MGRQRQRDTRVGGTKRAKNLQKQPGNRRHQTQQNRLQTQVDLQDRLSVLQSKLQLEADNLQLIVEEIRVRQNPLILEIVVDKTTGVDPVDLDLVAEFSRLASAILDCKENDPLPEAYLLEVTTRGAEAALTEPRHYARNIGRLISVKLDDGTKIIGRLQQAGETEFQIKPEESIGSTPTPSKEQENPNQNHGQDRSEYRLDTPDAADSSPELLTIPYSRVTKARPLIELNLGGES